MNEQSPQCCVCLRNNQEIHMILNALTNKLRNMKQNLENSQQLTIQLSQFNQGFVGLISLTFASKFKQVDRQMSCDHFSLKQFFCQSLNVSIENLDFLSNKLAAQKAKYQFHIDILTEQAASFPNSLFSQSSKFNSTKKLYPNKKTNKYNGLSHKDSSTKHDSDTSGRKSSNYCQQLDLIKSKISNLSIEAQKNLNKYEKYNPYKGNIFFHKQ